MKRLCLLWIALALAACARGPDRASSPDWAAHFDRASASLHTRLAPPRCLGPEDFGVKCDCDS